VGDGSSGWRVDGGIDEVPLPSGVPGRLWLCGRRAIGGGRFADPSVPWTTVVCLCRRHELSDSYPAYVRWLDDPASDAIWWPVRDLGASSVNETLPFIDGLVTRLRAGEALLVHCAAGLGRAGTTAVCVLVRLGLPLDEALSTVRKARAMAGPEVASQVALVREVAAAT